MTEPSDVRTGKDPTKAILSKSSLHKKHLCDYVVNVATGCRHGCKFCYVPSSPNIRARPEMLASELDVDDGQREWGEYVLYRDDLPEKLSSHLERKRTWDTSSKGCGIVGVSFSTDCYMDGRAGDITRRVVDTLSNHKRYTRVLTRNPILALQDIKTFQDAGEYVTIGSSIPLLDSNQVHAIEPRAPAPELRLKGLKEFDKMGVQTFVSMSPTYPTQNRSDLKNHLQRLSECNPSVIFHEPINPRGSNFEMTVDAARQAGETELADELAALRNTEHWVEYAVRHLRHVAEIGSELNLPIHLWPDPNLIRKTSEPISNWLIEWSERQSPEEFANREAPTSVIPDFPRDG